MLNHSVFYNRDTCLCLASRSSWEGACVRLEEGAPGVTGEQVPGVGRLRASRHLAS